MFEDIQKSKLIEKIRIMSATGQSGEEIKKSLSKEEITLMKSFSNDIEKGGKPAQVGEIREWQGKKMRKQPNGKWVEVSDKGMSRKEHEDKLVKFRDAALSMKVDSMAERNMLIAVENEEQRDKLSDKEYDESELSSERPKITDHNKLLEVLSDSELERLTSSKEYKEKYDEYLKESEPYGITKKDRREANQFALVYAYNNGGLSDEGVKEILTDKVKENLSKYTPEQRKLLLVEMGSAAKTPEQFEKIKAIGKYFEEVDKKSNNQGKVEEIDFNYSKDTYLVGDATGWRIPSKEQVENMTKDEIMEQLLKISDSQYSAQVRNQSLILDELTSLAKFYEALYKYKDSKENKN